MKLKFPSAYTILFGLIIAVAVATWFVQAGQYDREMNETLGKEVPIPGTYKEVDPNPQGFADVVLAPIAGFFDPGSYEARAIDVALFVLIIGGFLGVVTKTDAIDAGIERTMTGMRGREKWMIPILMALFAAGGTIYGMAEETLAFYGLIIPVMIAARYDAVTGDAIIMLGAGVGALGSTINPFATVIAANAAGVPITDGILHRRGPAGIQRSALPERSRGCCRQPPVGFHFAPQDRVAGLRPRFRGHDLGCLVRWLVDGRDIRYLHRGLDPGRCGHLHERGGLHQYLFDGARELLGVAPVIGIARGIIRSTAH
ncbi:YfcC family protein [Pelagibius litoralis]|uniref:YfcC family protein n=1 Tax=Pelagibius litoralis TaxID=374515 RepID=UPI00197DC193|nr:YfcC family protein [Pelagibius litoralis]